MKPKSKPVYFCHIIFAENIYSFVLLVGILLFTCNAMVFKNSQLRYQLQYVTLNIFNYRNSQLKLKL